MKNLKAITGVLAMLLFAGYAGAQQNPGFNASDMWLNPETDDFATIQQQVEAYYATHDQGRGSGYKQWKRWEYKMERRLDENGKIFNWVNAVFDEYHRYEHSIGNDPDRTWGGFWNQVGPTDYVRVGGGHNGGIGRVNCVAFHPSNSSILWAGTPAGGLWKTTNLGSTWTPMTDGLPSIGVSGIAVNPSNTNIIYILTGDGDGGDTRSIGVLKTTNGGETWLSTGLSWEITDGIWPYKLLMDPTNPNILLAATSTGVFRTTNGGASWTETFTGWTYDMEFKPGDHDILYLHTGSSFYKSVDNGVTWTIKTSGLPTGETRGAIGVTPDDDSYVYIITGPATAVGSFTGIYRSFDSGESFGAKANTPNILGYANDGQDASHQTTYDLAIAVSPTDEADIFTGGINIWKSTDWGNNMSNVTQWEEGLASTVSYCHADIHNIDFSPVDGSLFVCSDGGLYRSTNNGTSWSKLSSGMSIMQFYDIADFEGNSNHLIGGTQDNGCNYKNSNTTTWNHIEGADGSDVMIDHSNSATLYLAMNSSLHRSTNSGASVTNISPAYDNWPNIEMDASNGNRIYAGYSDIYRSDSQGNSGTWVNLTSSSSASGNRKLKLGINNTSRMYAANNTTGFWMSSNATAASPTWNSVSAGLPLVNNSVEITDIAVNPDWSLDVAVCLSGFSDGNKVYISDDAGSTWTNITGTLPNIPMNCIEWAPGSNDGLYVGADVGVYYRDADLGDWIPHRNGLPHVPVYDLEIHESSSKLRAGTHGRGVWESNLYTACPVGWTLTDGNLPGSGSQGYRYYQSSGTITSSRSIDGGEGTNVTYQAANVVTLIDGFEVVEHSKFRAFNAPCTTLPTEYSMGQEVTGVYAGPMEGVIEEVVGVEQLQDDEDYLLVYPNPTNGILNVEFSLEEEADVQLMITDLSGREVVRLIPSKPMQAGAFKVAHDIGHLSSGLYLCSLRRGDVVSTSRIAVTE